MPIDAFWLPLLVKIVATASIVVTASVVAERAGPFWGALIACLPVSAGPAYVLLALEADAPFIRSSALMGIAANAATGLFVLALHWLAPRRGIAVSLMGASAVWLAAILLIRASAPWSIASGILLNVIAYGVGLLAARSGGAMNAPAAAPRWFDIPMRALMVGSLVAGVVTVSRAIGPTATGLAVSFPISMTSLTLVLYRRLGGEAVARVMANSLKAMPGLGLALVIVAGTAVPFGVPLALLCGLAGSLVWTIGLMALRVRGRSGRVTAPSSAGHNT